ncbi:hypothetical protein FOZ61_000594 [Perkinsus olseni]|uniref:CCAAT-binding factor domain-containing protein n=1 Tax=Perkinsus olseni TaxID=32597 RepID=A0A7J6KSW6_PEROL|nr:hypothetical protein FOZ61_000594 [Perkinsus olseni]
MRKKRDVRPAHRGSRIHKRKRKADGPNQEDVQQRLRIIRLCLSGMHKAFTVANESLVEARLSEEAMNAILRLSYSRSAEVPPAARNAAVMLLIEITRAQTRGSNLSEEEAELESRCWRAIYHHVHSLESQSAANYIPLLQMVWELMTAKSTTPIMAAATSRRLLQLASMTVEPGMSAVAERALDLAAEGSEELRKLVSWEAKEGEKKYDPLERDPGHSAALDGSKCVWESLPMEHHYCPAVADKSGIKKTARETIELNAFPKALAALCINVEDQNEEEGQVALPCVLRYYNDPVVVALREERKRASEKNREDYVGVEDEGEEEEEEFFENAANEELGEDIPEEEEESEDEALAAALAEEEESGDEEDLGDFDADEDEEDAAAFAAMDGLGSEHEEEDEEEEKVEVSKSKNPRKRLRELMAGGTFVSADEVADLIAADNKRGRR